MTALPPHARRLIDEAVSRAGLPERDALRLRADLEQHLFDGLAAGQPLDALLERLGDPAAAAAPPARRSPGSTSTPMRFGGLGNVPADVRYTLRMLKKHLTMSVTVILVLALGIGTNTIVFTSVNELLLRPLPVEDPATLVDVWPDITGGNSFLGFPYSDVVTYQETNTVLTTLIGFAGVGLRVGDGVGGRDVFGQLVTPGYFEMLGLQASHGSLAFATDGQFGGEPTVVLAHTFWTSAYGADPGIVGRTVQLNGHTATVIGIGPEKFSGHFIGFQTDVWLPVTAAVPLIDGFDPSDRSLGMFEMIGRLEEGVTAISAQTALNVIAEGIERQHPRSVQFRVGVTGTTGLDHSLVQPVRIFLAILILVSTLVLVIACLNVGGILLLRMMSRDREIAVRLALGSGLRRLVAQLMTESAVLVSLGAVLGTIIAWQVTDSLGNWIYSITGRIHLALGMDWRVLLMTAGAASVAVVLAGAAPVMHIAGRNPADALRSRSGDRRSDMRLRSLLVVGQVAVSVMLVLTTGLFVRALIAGAQTDPGFDPDRLGTLRVSFTQRPETAAETRIMPQLTQAIGALPNVDAVSFASSALLGVARTPTPVDIPGVQPPPGADAVVVDSRVVGADYLATVGIPLVAGRDFVQSDEQLDHQVAVVSAEFVRRFWPGESVIGRSLRVDDRPVQIVGIAADARYLIQDESPDPLVYLSAANTAMSSAQVVFASANPLQAAALIEDIVKGIDPDHETIRLRTPREALENALFPQRVGVVMIGVAGITALILAAIGLYGVIQYTVTRDARELGIRLALGGDRTALLFVVLRRGFLLAAAGMGLGLLAAFLFAPGMRAFLVGISPSDPITYGLVTLTFTVVALLATCVPALRATRIPPTTILRGD